MLYLKNLPDKKITITCSEVQFKSTKALIFETHFMSTIHQFYNSSYLIYLKASAEPMQVDAAPEENDNVEDVQFMVESTSLVSVCIALTLYL